MLSLIVNPHAGGGRCERLLPGVLAELDRRGLEYRVTLTRGIEHARELGRAAAEAEETAVAFGGDGLVGAVAGAIRERAGLLGVLPGGRGNDLARVLGIPLEPVAACEVLATGNPSELDLGLVGSRTFVGIASCGFDSEANRIANATRLIRGNLVYAYGALRALIGWRPARFEVTLDGGEHHEIVGYSVAAANSKAYGGGMMLAPDASLQDGMLDVVIIAAGPKLRFLRLLPTVFNGEHVRHAGVQVLRAREVRIAADRPFTLYADGDPIGTLPVTVSTAAGAIRVMVPA